MALILLLMIPCMCGIEQVRWPRRLCGPSENVLKKRALNLNGLHKPLLGQGLKFDLK